MRDAAFCKYQLLYCNTQFNRGGYHDANNTQSGSHLPSLRAPNELKHACTTHTTCIIVVVVGGWWWQVQQIQRKTQKKNKN